MTPSEYISKAAEVIAKAEQATTPEQVREFTQLAEQYLELAEKADRSRFNRRMVRDPHAPPQPQQPQQSKSEEQEE